MSHKSFFALDKRTQIARINAAYRHANDNRIEPLLVNEVQNEELPPHEMIDEVLQAELHERGAAPDLQANDWDNFIHGINVVNPNEDIVLIGEPVDGDAFNQNQHENQIYDVDDIFNEDNEPENPSSDEEDEEMNENDREPLYHHARITVKESMLLLLSLMLRHNLNMTCISDIIAVIQLHCPQDGFKKNSLYKFRKYCSISKDNKTKKHYYCPQYMRELENENNICPSCPQQRPSYFVELPVMKHIQEMYKRRNFYDKLQLRFDRREEQNCIRDIYDGRLYKDWVNNGFLANRSNISFSWYTDGVPVFKSSKICVWPLCLTINEMPPSERKKKENTLVIGLWHGEKKPHFNYFFYKMRTVIETLFRGVEVTLPAGNIITVRGVLLLGTCDMPAKSECLNFVQFNGRYGCPVCLTPGESTRTGPRSFVHTYPYVDDIIVRTSQICITYAGEARPGTPVFGVKGETALSRLMPDFVKGMAIDRMHALDGGVMKKLLTLWFHPKYSEQPMSLVRHSEEINSRLMSIKPQKFVHRMPRSIEDSIHLKASELKMFLFYYSIAVLEGIMAEEYFNNFRRLLVASVILSGDEITEMMIEVADDLLRRFVNEFEDLYGLQYCSINIHTLLHLADCVRNLGPLWVYTCYEYEDLNGQFLKLIHGTWHVESQIATIHSQCIKMIRYIDELPVGDVREFCLRKKRQVKIIEQTADETYSVGAYRALHEVPRNIQQSLLDYGLEVEQYKKFKYLRLLKHKKLYVSDEYRKVMQTSSSAIQYFNNADNEMKYGLVQHFLKLIDSRCRHNNCDCEAIHLAIVMEVVCDSMFQADGNQFRYNTAGFFHKCHATNNIKVVPVDSIRMPCFYINIDGQSYIAIPINNKELE